MHRGIGAADDVAVVSRTEVIEVPIANQVLNPGTELEWRLKGWMQSNTCQGRVEPNPIFEEQTRQRPGRIPPVNDGVIIMNGAARAMENKDV